MVDETQVKQSFLSQKCEALKESIKKNSRSQQEERRKQSEWMIGLVSIVLMYGMYFYLSKAILHPFDRMKQYTERIARGDFDFGLQVERANYFGDFTWAFDSMRCEVLRARASEKEQIENNQTVIATLSHDIKTPIASLRAYAEGLEAGMDESLEKRVKYTSTIIKKCDEVAKLTDDLFLHSLVNLNKLKVKIEPVNLSELLLRTVEELNATSNYIIYVETRREYFKCFQNFKIEFTSVNGYTSPTTLLYGGKNVYINKVNTFRSERDLSYDISISSI